MRHDSERFHRRSIRLKGYDYRTPGLYVVTICTRYGASLFGEIVNGEMRLSPAGAMVQDVWHELPWAYPGVEIDAFVVMPNHIHGIVCLLPNDGEADHIEVANPVRATPCGCPFPQSPLPDVQARSAPGQAQGPARTDPFPIDATAAGNRRLSLPDVVHRYKSLTTNRYGDGVRDRGWTPYEGRLWHRNYYEHIVRNERELDRFRRYVDENPIRWMNDRHHPANLEID